jgi:hypothetical protein
MHFEVPNAIIERQYAASGIRVSFRRLGRIGGYQVRFDRQRGFRTDVVISSASVYRTTTAAHRGFAVTARILVRGANVRLRPLAAPRGLGPDAKMWRAERRPHGALRATAVIVLWRSRTALGLIDVGGIGSPLGRDVALRLARAQQARIARAGS